MTPIPDEQSRVYPIPEIFPEEGGRGWKIRHDEEKAGVDYEAKVILAPLTGDAVDHCVKMQQIARIKWDDRSIDLKDLDKSMLFQAVEDNRLSFLLQQAGIDISAGFFNDAAIKKVTELAGPTGAICMMLMSDYTDNAPSAAFLEARKEEQLVKLFVEARTRIAANPTKRAAVETVRWLLKFIEDKPMGGWMSARCKIKMPFCAGDGREDCKGLDFDDCYELAWEDLEDDMKLQELPSEVREQLPKDLPDLMKARIQQYKQNHNKGFNPWGAMEIHEPSRPINAVGKFMKRWKATEEGVFPRYPHRYAVDQRIFARRYKLPGGTVIIDSSGSMGLSAQAIKMMVEHAPGCVVANYSGTGPKGVLRILAKGGMRVTDEMCSPPCGGGNIVDYPALKWAYKLSHPRVWVSDMGVTGIGDHGTQGNMAMCAAAVKKGRFFHASNCEEAVAILKRLGRFYRKA